jgi:hypothetical protein
MAYFLDSIVLAVIGSVPLSIAGFYNWVYPNLPDRSAFALAMLLAYILNAAYFVWFWTGDEGRPRASAFSISRLPTLSMAGRCPHVRRSRGGSDLASGWGCHFSCRS